DRYLVYANLRGDRLRFQKAGLSVGTTRVGSSARRSSGERIAPEFDYVSRIACDLLGPTDFGSDHRRGDLLFYSANHHPLVEAIPRTTCRSASAAGSLIVPELSPASLIHSKLSTRWQPSIMSR